mgnify:CR=1 FL=1
MSPRRKDAIFRAKRSVACFFTIRFWHDQDKSHLYATNQLNNFTRNTYADKLQAARQHACRALRHIARCVIKKCGFSWWLINFLQQNWNVISLTLRAKRGAAWRSRARFISGTTDTQPGRFLTNGYVRLVFVDSSRSLFGVFNNY